jgi:hypothetical protein
MKITHVANPVRVHGRQITAVDLQPSGTAHLTLDDGGTAEATVEMMARITPQIGDYLVEQLDGYLYLNPKSVFEHKYSPLPAVEDTGGAQAD